MPGEKRVREVPEGGMSMERLVAVVFMIALMAFAALIVTGCVFGIYALVGMMV